MITYYALMIGEKYEMKRRTFGECCQMSILIDINPGIRWRARIAPCTSVISRRSEIQSEFHFIVASHTAAPFNWAILTEMAPLP
ncbi:hypothetical protein MAXJ12_36326 [Mesorhizobium alhagi CCNWXJ12-2]|uniref:Uncharacterized protein n=1 Tax=Mesorhizobium alhagi CCNWXJ12-2 TaxID=1107882 RepID=H0I442_9HYPH|nr:hypothetical protein MAXJ12_36326 [Mesorhizobium alhagi CCNWXJ12-2]